MLEHKKTRKRVCDPKTDKRFRTSGLMIAKAAALRKLGLGYVEIGSLLETSTSQAWYLVDKAGKIKCRA